MEDSDLIRRIGELVEREHHLERDRGHRPLNDTEHQELGSIEVELDQCWDLLRQRKAKREFGLDPNEAVVRSVDTVEHYRQ